MTDKIYCGNGTKRDFDNGGHIISVSLNLTELKKHIAEYGWTSDAGNKYIKLNIGSLKDGPNQYGKTHWVAVDTWKPDQRVDDAPQQKLHDDGFPDIADDEDIPF